MTVWGRLKKVVNAGWNRMTATIWRNVHVRSNWLVIGAITIASFIIVASVKAESFKDGLQSVQAILTCTALVIGGVWFLHRRKHYPRAEIFHSIRSIPSSGDGGGTLLLIRIRINNKGDLPITLNEGQYEIRGVPQGERPIKSGSIFDDDQRVVEPGESEEKWLELSVGEPISVIACYTCIKNCYRNDNFHWDKLSYYSLSDRELWE